MRLNFPLAAAAIVIALAAGPRVCTCAPARQTSSDSASSASGVLTRIILLGTDGGPRAYPARAEPVVLICLRRRDQSTNTNKLRISVIPHGVSTSVRLCRGSDYMAFLDCLLGCSAHSEGFRTATPTTRSKPQVVPQVLPRCSGS